MFYAESFLHLLLATLQSHLVTLGVLKQTMPCRDKMVQIHWRFLGYAANRLQIQHRFLFATSRPISDRPAFKEASNSTDVWEPDQSQTVHSADPPINKSTQSTATNVHKELRNKVRSAVWMLRLTCTSDTLINHIMDAQIHMCKVQNLRN